MTADSLVSVQKELDGLQKQVDSRFSSILAKLDKLVTLTEHDAEKRINDLRFNGIQEDVSDLKKDINHLDSTMAAHFTTLQNAIQTETTARSNAFSEAATNETKRKAEELSNRRQKVFLILGLVIPSVIALVTNLLQIIK